MKVITFFVLVIISVLVTGTIVKPSIYFVVHELKSDEESVLIHASNITENSISFIRLEISYLEPVSTHGGWIVQPYRKNALCACGEVCNAQNQTIAPWGSAEFNWDMNSDDCQKAKPGRYQVQLVDACEFEGCLGSYQIGIGEGFNVH